MEEFDYTFDALAELTLELLDQLGHDRFALYVQDYGAPIGFRIASQNPERISALITQNGNAYMEGLTPFWDGLFAYAADGVTNAQAVRDSLEPAGTRWVYEHGVPVGRRERLSPDTWTLDQAGLERRGNKEVQLALFRDYRFNLDLYPAFQEYFRAHQPPTLVGVGRARRDLRPGRRARIRPRPSRGRDPPARRRPLRARDGGRGDRVARPRVPRPGPLSAAMPRSLILLFAIACGLAVANIYYAQPLLVEIARSFGISTAAVGVVVTGTQVGYALGLILLVPLGDMLDRRRLIVTLSLLSVAALAVVGTASSTAVLLAGTTAVGAFAVVIQVLVAYAATWYGHTDRGRVVGLVTSGVVAGIVLARTAAGLLTDLWGWRAVYIGSAALTLVVAILLLRALPSGDRPATATTYGRLLRSLLALYRREPVLRARATLAFLIFATFSVLWSSLVLPLSAPPLALSPGTIGTLGLVGVAGAVAAVRAGRRADRGRGQATTGGALALMLVAWLPIALVHESIVAFVIGLLLVDVALQAVHVTSQTMIYALDPAARSRLVGVYMVFYSAGSAAGSIAATAIYAWAGWTGVCLLGAGISTVALAVWALSALGENHTQRAPALTGTSSGSVD